MQRRNRFLLAPWCSIFLGLSLGCWRDTTPARDSAAATATAQGSAQPAPPPTAAPAPTADPSIQKAWERLGSESPLVSRATPPPELGPPTAEPSPALPTETLAPPNLPPQQESEVDIKRRIGVEAFDREVAALSKKADEADVAWNRFLEGCRANVTSVTAVAGVADRVWIAFAGANVTTTKWTEACAEAGTFFALVRQVRDGMCVAEDRARQHWVYPGTTREILHKYRLDWEGWDSACR